MNKPANIYKSILKDELKNSSARLDSSTKESSTRDI